MKIMTTSGVYRQDSQLWTAFGSFCTDMAKTPYPRRLYSSAYLHIYLAQRPQYSGRSFPPPVRSALSFIYAGGDQGESISLSPGQARTMSSSMGKMYLPGRSSEKRSSAASSSSASAQ